MRGAGPQHSLKPKRSLSGDERAPGTSGGPERDLGPPSLHPLASPHRPPVLETPQADEGTCLIPAAVFTLRRTGSQ